MSQKKMDMAKVLAILAQPKEELPLLTKVVRVRIEIPYITKKGIVDVRPVRLVLPESAEKPMPLIYVPHYEMGEDSLELRDYIAQGWAVACPDEFKDEYNGVLTDDDLVFNNAAVYTLRNRPEIDKERIILVGGSAGGYMTMMLSGLQLGLCASIANGPVTNVYFNFFDYFQKGNEWNTKALMKIMSEKDASGEIATEDSKERTQLELMQSLMKLPVPFLAAVGGLFQPIVNDFPDASDTGHWEAISPVGIADRFSSPIMVNHCTSDILVPVDQISKRFTYDKPGDSLPEVYDTRLSEDFDGKLKYSLEERLPQEHTCVNCVVVPEHAEEESILPFDLTKQFNLNIFDDGPVEGYGSHSSRMDVGRRLDVPYLEAMFAQTAVKTCRLTPAMLKSMLERYMGRCRTLPAHIDVDDSVYGSLAIYQQEVCDSLKNWAKHHGQNALNTVFEDVLSTVDPDTAAEYQSIMKKLAPNI